MKTFKEFLLEASSKTTESTNSTTGQDISMITSTLKSPLSQVGSFARNLIDPTTGTVSRVATELTRQAASKLPKPLQGPVRQIAPLVGTAAGMTKRAPHASVVLSTFNQRTAAGRVPVRGSDGKTYYMDK